jgi:hypothetical protein
MRIPDDIEELVLAFMEPEMKKGLMHMTRDEIDALVMQGMSTVVSEGYVEASTGQAFGYSVTAKGKEIMKILAPCKRSGR